VAGVSVCESVVAALRFPSLNFATLRRPFPPPKVWCRPNPCGWCFCRPNSLTKQPLILYYGPAKIYKKLVSGNGKSHVRLSQVGCPCGRLPAALAASSRRPAGPVRARVRLQQGCSAMPRASLLASSESCYISRSRFASSVLAVGITAGLAQLRSAGRAVTGGGGARTRSGWPGGRVIAASCLKACLLWVGSIGDVSPV